MQGFKAAYAVGLAIGSIASDDAVIVVMTSSSANRESALAAPGGEHLRKASNVNPS